MLEYSNINFNLDPSINVNEVNGHLQSNESLKILINSLFSIIQKQNDVIANNKDYCSNDSQLLNKLVKNHFILAQTDR